MSAERKPVPWQDVVAGIRAVADEASRRGEMYPQTADEQRADRAAAHRVCEMIEWYATKGGAVAERLPTWPKIDHADAAAAALVKALTIAVRQNSHDMLMTADELRVCEAALAAAKGAASHG